MLLILPVVALILEISPYGAVCNFARPAVDGSIGYFRELYSYFDLLPFGYGNFAPFLTAIMTCAIIVLLTIYALTGHQQILNVSKIILGGCAVISLCPLLLGVHFLSLFGILISLTLAAEWLLIHLASSN